MSALREMQRGNNALQRSRRRLASPSEGGESKEKKRMQKSRHRAAGRTVERPVATRLGKRTGRQQTTLRYCSPEQRAMLRLTGHWQVQVPRHLYPTKENLERGGSLPGLYKQKGERAQSSNWPSHSRLFLLGSASSARRTCPGGHSPAA